MTPEAFQAHCIARLVLRAFLIRMQLSAKAYWTRCRWVTFPTCFYHQSLISSERVLDQLLEYQNVAAQHVNICSSFWGKAEVSDSQQEALTIPLQLALCPHGFRGISWIQ